MNALAKARARLKALVGDIEAIDKKDTLTADDLKALNEKTAEAEDVEKQIEALEKAEAVRARSTVPAGQLRSEEAEDGADSVPAAVERKIEPDQKVSLIAAATVKAKASSGLTPLKVLSDNGYPRFAKELEAEMRRKQVDTTAASVLIPTMLQSEIIELLRPETTFLAAGPKRVQLTNGQFKSPRGASGATASYVGEGAKKPVTGPTFDSITMSAKKLAGIVLITQEARDWSLPNLDAYIRDDLRSAMGQAMDLNAYFGTGAGDSPTGILNIAGVPNFDDDNYFVNPLAPTITEIDKWASAMVLSLTLANISSSPRWAWLMNYRSLEYLKNLRVGDDTGVYAYPELRGPAPMFKGYRVLVTNQVPINLGVTTDESIVALIDFTHALFGEQDGMEVKTSDQATIDVNGTLVHLFQQNMYAILTEMQHDFGLRHLQAAVKTHGIRWGATDTSSSPV